MPNLLPAEEKKILYANYRNKLVIVALSFVLISIFLAFILLVPAYILSISKLKSAQNELEILKESVSYRESTEVEVENKNIHNQLALLRGRINGVFLQDYINLLTNTSSDKIFLESISYRNVDDNTSEISFSGLALTRQDLIDYVDILESLEEFEEINLPISTLAKDKNINFSLTAKIIKQK